MLKSSYQLIESISIFLRKDDYYDDDDGDGDGDGGDGGSTLPPNLTLHILLITIPFAFDCICH